MAQQTATRVINLLSCQKKKKQALEENYVIMSGKLVLCTELTHLFLCIFISLFFPLRFDNL